MGASNVSNSSPTTTSLFGKAGQNFQNVNLSFELAKYIAQRNLLDELKEMASETSKNNAIVINSPTAIKDEKGHILRVEGKTEKLNLSNVGDLLKLQVHQNYLEAKTNVLYNLGDMGLKKTNTLLSTRKS